MERNDTLSALSALLNVKKDCDVLSNELERIHNTLKGLSINLKNLHGTLEDVVNQDQDDLNPMEAFLIGQLQKCEQLILDLKVPTSAIIDASFELHMFHSDLGTTEVHMKRLRGTL